MYLLKDEDLFCLFNFIVNFSENVFKKNFFQGDGKKNLHFECCGPIKATNVPLGGINRLMLK